MAMSFHSILESPLDQVSNELFLPFHDHEAVDALLGSFSDSWETSQLAVDSFFDLHDHQLLDQNDFILLPSISAPSMLDLPPLIDDEFDLCRCPKRPRRCGDLYSGDIYSGDIYSDSYDLMLQSDSYCNAPMVAPAMAQFNAPTAALPVGAMCTEEGEKKAGGGGFPSAQSVAARERRKRISEKTQELGKLIPGGSRMNTAEMFQAAYKYVKLLQAQAGILGFINSIQNGGQVSEKVEERLQVLLTSTAVQEKLRMEERCLIPKEALEAIKEEKEVKSNPLISRELDRFTQSMK